MSSNESIALHKGDCLTILPTLPDKCVDLVITDLPYGQTDCEWDCKIDLTALWIQLKRVARNKHTPFFFFTTTKFGYDLIKSNPKWFRYDLVVEKTNCVGYLCARKMPMRKHEMLYVFYDKLPVYNVDAYHTKNPNIRPDFEEISLYGVVMRRHKSNYTPNLPSSILKMNNFASKARNHPTEKTQDILEWIIKYYSKENDTVLDPTMGSGSTAVACKTLKRNFIGIELNDKFFEVAEKRSIHQDTQSQAP